MQRGQSLPGQYDLSVSWKWNSVYIRKNKETFPTEISQVTDKNLNTLPFRPVH